MSENPQAFPSIETHPSYDIPLHHFGMTLRDWFAGQAIIGVIANSEAVHAGAEPTNSAMNRPDFPIWLARTAYRVADAMLAERVKEQSSCQ